MQIVMIPGLCANKYSATAGSFCQSCFSSFLEHGCYPDRPCITNVIDDGSAETTLILKYGDNERAILLTDEVRDALAYGGWQGWIDFRAAPGELLPDATGAS
jgi:hypothetical protein